MPVFTPEEILAREPPLAPPEASPKEEERVAEARQRWSPGPVHEMPHVPTPRADVPTPPPLQERVGRAEPGASSMDTWAAAFTGMVLGLLTFGLCVFFGLDGGYSLVIAGFVAFGVFNRIRYKERKKLRTRPRTPKAQDLSAELENVASMSGRQFEVFVADLVRAMGHQAAVLGGSGDQGVDIIAIVSNQRVAIQCKNYRKAVGNKPVQEVFAGSRHHRCQQAWVVAPAGFTKGAVELARSVGVMLFNANSIRKWIQQADRHNLEQGQSSDEIEGPEPR